MTSFPPAWTMQSAAFSSAEGSKKQLTLGITRPDAEFHVQAADDLLSSSRTWKMTLIKQEAARLEGLNPWESWFRSIQTRRNQAMPCPTLLYICGVQEKPLGRAASWLWSREKDLMSRCQKTNDSATMQVFVLWLWELLSRPTCDDWSLTHAFLHYLNPAGQVPHELQKDFPPPRSTMTAFQELLKQQVSCSRGLKILTPLKIIHKKMQKSHNVQ